jgi:DNA-binding transcriptional MerR regulator
MTAERRAFYSEAHVRRLRVVFALRAVGGLSVQTIREICQVLGRRTPSSPSQALARTMDALAQRTEGEEGTDVSRARRELLDFLRSKGVRVRPRAGTLDELARALVALRRGIGPEVGPRDFEPYLDAMGALADRDFRANRHLFGDPTTAPEAATMAALFGTVLWEPVLILLRRIALEHVVMREWGTK